VSLESISILFIIMIVSQPDERVSGRADPASLAWRPPVFQRKVASWQRRCKSGELALELKVDLADRLDP